jgi:membrane associated rhomboid family serine protease
MLLLDFLQDIAIILWFFGSKITNKLGLVGVVLFYIFCILKVLIKYHF